MVKGRPLPDLFLEKLRRIIPANQWEKTVKTFSSERPTTLRVNTLKNLSGSLKEKLEPRGFKIENVTWYKDAFILRKGKQKDLEKTDLYLRGQIYVQGLSSMIPPLVLNPQPGDSVLDLTAAPGSKTTQLSCLMKGQGMITANDENPIRLEKMKANLELQEATNVTLLPPGDGGMVWKNNFEAFDRVLLDAPCSSEGRFQLDEPFHFRLLEKRYQPEDGQGPAPVVQIGLSCLKARRDHGLFHLHLRAGRKRDGIELGQGYLWGRLGNRGHHDSLPLHTRGLSAWGDLKFDPAVVKSIRILPTADIEGFLPAKIKKTKSVPRPKPEPFEPLKL